MTAPTDYTLLAVGSPYPLALPVQEGASAQILDQLGGFIFVNLPGMRAREEHALRQGPMTAGMLTEGPAILLLFRFHDKNGQPLLTFDCPFDIRLVPPERRFLPDVESGQERLLVEVHAVSDGILRGLRGISLPKRFTLRLLSAVQDQLASVVDAQPILSRWYQLEPNDLYKLSNAEACGK